VRAENDFGSGRFEVLDGGKSGADPGVIGDFEGVIFRDVEVDADEDFFSSKIEITDGKFIHNERALECLMGAGVSRREPFARKGPKLLSVGPTGRVERITRVP